MESLYLLIPLSIAIVFFAIWIFFRMSDSGQFDDMLGPSLRILQDDDSAQEADPALPADGNKSNKLSRKNGPHRVVDDHHM